MLLIIRIQSHIVLLYITIIVSSFKVTHNKFYVEATHFEMHPGSYFYYYNVIIIIIVIILITFTSIILIVIAIISIIIIIIIINPQRACARGLQ